LVRRAGVLSEPWHGIYRLLASTGMPRGVPGCRLELDGEDTSSEAALAVGWPDLRVGLANDGDDASAFHDAGWRVVRLDRGDVDAYGRVLDAVGAVASAGLGGERRDAEPVRLLRDGPGTYDLAWHGIYRLLASTGMPRATPRCPLGPEASAARTVALGWPDRALALALDSDDAAAFEKAGWTVVRLAVDDVHAYGRVLEVVAALAMWGLLAESRLGARRRVSEPEQVLLRALVDAGLPPPERNLTFHARADGGGRVIAVPDFAWDELEGLPVRVVVEVDGFYFHAGRELSAELAAAAESDPDRRKQLAQHQRLQAAKDAAKRRSMSALGWVVLVVHDTELENLASVTDVAQSIRRVLDRRLSETRAAPR